MKHIGVSIARDRAAIVTVRVDGDPRAFIVLDAERLPLRVADVAARIRDLEGDDVRIAIDAPGLGRSLFEVLGEDVTLYEKSGRDRQQLVTTLATADALDRLHFAPGFPELDALLRALASKTTEVSDDGIVGGELVTALSVALAIEPPVTYEFIPLTWKEDDE